MNFGDAQTYVLDRLQIPATDAAKVTQVKNLLNLEVARVNADYNLTVTSAATTVLANTGLIVLPADFQKLVTFRQTTVVLEILDELNFAMRQADIAAGTASAVSNPPTTGVFRSPLTIATLPIPTSNVAGTLVYVQRPATLSSNATDLPIPVEFHDLICEVVVRRMALTEGEPAIAQIANDLALELRAHLEELITQQPGQSSWAIPLHGYTV